MVRVEQLSDLETAKQVATLLEAENARLHQRLEALVAENARLKGEDAQEKLQLELMGLKEQLALLQQRLFGASSERLGDKPPKPPRAKPRRGHGPRAQPELKVQEVLLPLDEADRVCGLCGSGLHAWEGQTEDGEEITVVERSFLLRRVKRQKYRCGHGCAPVTAPAPPRLIPGGRYSVDFAVHVALMKYGFHLPLARQERLYGREGLVVEAQTLWDQLDALAGHLQPSYEALPAHVFSSPLVHADETHWYLLEKGPGTKWYAWTVASPDTVYHRILPSRSGATARTVLGDYAGVVLVDGYAAYQTATKSGADGPAPATLAFCWAHVRRKFFEAQKVAPACKQVLTLIGELYAIEADLPGWYALGGETRQAALAHRCAVRQQKSAPLVERIRQWALAQRALPGSAFRKALEYMLGLWSGLTLFLTHPQVPLDNNHVERQLRDMVLGRKNHYGSKSQRGTEVAALFYSLVETARLRGEDPGHYLRRAALAAIENPGTVTLPKSQG
ncbi:IS66 family transposase [Corallococcus sp. AB032C]|uniref:IS66 family transposase n=1 Tax=Corallococcus TaxID=83461 RepID=UPI000EED2B5A|nr:MULTISPECIES: IS66 family transposase [Corallococcus]NPC53548.1 IS66 family transposase [Corallococcus exiguus]NPC76462.1 IS66 family transposase [Corallococcus exiguus]RKH72216.1 IS66 family transposase [Corallococcus sp. AB032C]